MVACQELKVENTGFRKSPLETRLSQHGSGGRGGSRHADTEVLLVMFFFFFFTDGSFMVAFAPTQKAEEECMKAIGEGSLAYRSAGH